MYRFSPSNLRKAMEEEGYSQAELARRMGVSRASVSRVLGNLRTPSSKFIALLKLAFPSHPLEFFFKFDKPE